MCREGKKIKTCRPTAEKNTAKDVRRSKKTQKYNNNDENNNKKLPTAEKSTAKNVRRSMNTQKYNNNDENNNKKLISKDQGESHHSAGGKEVLADPEASLKQTITDKAESSCATKFKCRIVGALLKSHVVSQAVPFNSRREEEVFTSVFSEAHHFQAGTIKKFIEPSASATCVKSKITEATKNKNRLALRVENLDAKHRSTTKDELFSKAEREANRIIDKERSRRLRRQERKCSSEEGGNFKVLTLSDVNLLNIGDVPKGVREFYFWTAASGRDVELCGIEKGGAKINFGGTRIRDPAAGFKVKLKFYRISFDEAGDIQGNGGQLCGWASLDLASLENGYLNELCGDLFNLVHIRAELSGCVTAQVAD